jgi:hypothetical protein
MEGMKAFKRTLHAGKGKPIEFVTGTKAYFHYEAKVPRDGLQGWLSYICSYQICTG